MDFPNQPLPFEGFNLFDADAALQQAVARDAAQGSVTQLRAWGETLGRPDTYALADAATAPRCTRTIAAASGSTRSSFIRPGMR